MLDKIVIRARNCHLLTNPRAFSLVFFRKSELESKGHYIGLFSANIDGEEWTTWGSDVFVDNKAYFLGMDIQRFGFYIPPKFIKEYEKEHGEEPVGIWSYDPQYGGDPVRGSFISANELRQMAQNYIDECVKLGLYEKEK